MKPGWRQVREWDKKDLTAYVKVPFNIPKKIWPFLFKKKIINHFIAYSQYSTSGQATLVVISAFLNMLLSSHRSASDQSDEGCSASGFRLTLNHCTHCCSKECWYWQGHWVQEACLLWLSSAGTEEEACGLTLWLIIPGGGREPLLSISSEQFLCLKAVLSANSL